VAPVGGWGGGGGFFWWGGGRRWGWGGGGGGGGAWGGGGGGGGALRAVSWRAAGYHLARRAGAAFRRTAKTAFTSPFSNNLALHRVNRSFYCVTSRIKGFATRTKTASQVVTVAPCRHDPRRLRRQPTLRVDTYPREASTAFAGRAIYSSHSPGMRGRARSLRYQLTQQVAMANGLS